MIDETTECREAALAGRLAFLDTGVGTAVVQLYAAPRAANASTAPGGAPLVEIPLAVPAGTVSGGVLELLPAATGLIVNTGVPTWARVKNRGGVTAFDMDAGVVGSGPGGTDPECVVTTDNLYAGGQVAMLSALLG